MPGAGMSIAERGVRTVCLALLTAFGRPLTRCYRPASRLAAADAPPMKMRAPCSIRCFTFAAPFKATGRPNSFPAARMASTAFATAAWSLL